MAKEEILAIEAGEELDRLIAVEIMDLICVFEPRYYMWDGEEFWFDMEGRPDCGPRFYSTDISAAWQVVEKMEQDGWNWDASGRIGREHIEPFKRFYFKPNVYDPVYPLSSIIRADGKRLPEAICKAALLAKMTYVLEGEVICR